MVPSSVATARCRRGNGPLRGAQARHALAAELDDREDDGGARRAHPLEGDVHVSHAELKDHRRATQRGRRIGVPGASFLGHREANVADREVRMRDGIPAPVHEADHFTGTERTWPRRHRERRGEVRAKGQRRGDEDELCARADGRLDPDSGVNGAGAAAPGNGHAGTLLGVAAVDVARRWRAARVGAVSVDVALGHAGGRGIHRVRDSRVARRPVAHRRIGQRAGARHANRGRAAVRAVRPIARLSNRGRRGTFPNTSVASLPSRTPP